ncbi:hypothetical protein C8R41DRAFT_863479 [Lentinula lateritia]|uniref:Uncharacterized protein n=1 Tax=Lentinula lateritia TaxID=40482 RepID=A0ABQ8VVW2_9AGAR|nr:hypothetical protein C8R41DRAFT_863479 [Lentinula lateritia]
MSTLDQIESENGQWASADHEWNTFTNFSTGNNQQLTYGIHPLKKRGVNYRTTWNRQSTFVGPALLSRRDTMPNRDIFPRYGRRRCCLAIFEWNTNPITPMFCDLSLVNIFALSPQRARSANFKKSHEPFAWGIPTRANDTWRNLWRGKNILVLFIHPMMQSTEQRNFVTHTFDSTSIDTAFSLCRSYRCGFTTSPPLSLNLQTYYHGARNTPLIDGFVVQKKGAIVNLYFLQITVTQQRTDQPLVLTAPSKTGRAESSSAISPTSLSDLEEATASSRFDEKRPLSKKRKLNSSFELKQGIDSATMSSKIVPSVELKLKSKYRRNISGNVKRVGVDKFSYRCRNDKITSY